MLQISKCNISFFIDAIKALKTGNIRSKVVSSCHKELLALREQHNINLYWVPCHIIGNEKADELAERGAHLPQENAVMKVSFKILSKKLRTEWSSRWQESDCYIQTKQLWEEEKIKYSNILLEMNKTQLRMVINLITGHNTLGKHMVRLGIIEDDTCRLCREAVEESYITNAIFKILPKSVC